MEYIQLITKQTSYNMSNKRSEDLNLNEMEIVEYLHITQS